MSNSEYKSDKIILLTRKTQDDFYIPASEQSLWHLSGLKIHFHNSQDFALKSLYYILNEEKEYLANGVDSALNYYKEQINFNKSPTEQELEMCLAQLKEKPQLIEDVINSLRLLNTWDNVLIMNENKESYEFIFGRQQLKE